MSQVDLNAYNMFPGRYDFNVSCFAKDLSHQFQRYNRHPHQAAMAATAAFPTPAVTTAMPGCVQLFY